MEKVDEKLNKWIKWIDEIRKDTEDMLANREIFNQYILMIKSNKEIQSPSSFHEWVMRNYGSYVVMAIRRQLDKDDGVISLRRLLKEISESPQLITKEWFKILYLSTPKIPVLIESFSDSDFESVAGKMKHFDPGIALEDISKLDILGEKIAHYANKKIAHRTKIRPSLTFKEIDFFLKEFEELVKKYILLLTAAGYVDLTPVYQYNWLEIFTKPWMDPDTFQV